MLVNELAQEYVTSAVRPSREINYLNSIAKKRKSVNPVPEHHSTRASSVHGKSSVQGYGKKETAGAISIYYSLIVAYV